MGKKWENVRRGGIIGCMTRRKFSNSVGSVSAFPYSVLWEEIGDYWVTFEHLALSREEYRAHSEISSLLGLELPSPDRMEFEGLVAGLSLTGPESDRLVEESQLIAGWYLMPQFRMLLHNDLASVRKKLKRVAQLSRELYDISNQVTPHVEAIMDMVRANEPDVFQANGSGLLSLGVALHDLSVVADRVVRDTAPRRSGRGQEYLRDTTIRLAIDAARSAGLDDLTLSRGTGAMPEPHLNGRAGQFLRGLFALIAPNLSEGSLVPAIERVRRRMKA